MKPATQINLIAYGGAVGTLSMLFAYSYCAILFHDKPTILIAVFCAFIGIYVAEYRIWKKHNKVFCPITEEDKQQTDFSRIELSNRFSWGFVLYLIIYMGIIFLMSWYFMVMEEGTSIRHQLILWGVIITFFLVIYAPSICSIWKNKYILENNTLIIVEYNYFLKESEIRIPLSAIDEVYLEAQLVNPYITKVVIRVQGIEKKLNSYSYPIRLAKEIQLRQKYSSIT